MHCIVHCIICVFSKVIDTPVSLSRLICEICSTPRNYMQICLYVKTINLLNLLDFNTHTHTYYKYIISWDSTCIYIFSRNSADTFSVGVAQIHFSSDSTHTFSVETAQIHFQLRHHRYLRVKTAHIYISVGLAHVHFNWDSTHTYYVVIVQVYCQ